MGTALVESAETQAVVLERSPSRLPCSPVPIQDRNVETFSPNWSPISFVNQPPSSPEWLDRLVRHHPFPGASIDINSGSEDDHLHDPEHIFSTPYYNDDNLIEGKSERLEKGGKLLRKMPKRNNTAGNLCIQGQNQHQNFPAKPKRNARR